MPVARGFVLFRMIGESADVRGAPLGCFRLTFLAVPGVGAPVPPDPRVRPSGEQRCRPKIRLHHDAPRLDARRRAPITDSYAGDGTNPAKGFWDWSQGGMCNALLYSHWGEGLSAHPPKKHPRVDAGTVGIRLLLLMLFSRPKLGNPCSPARVSGEPRPCNSLSPALASLCRWHANRPPTRA
jgi:hypothetical protein